MDWVLFFYMRTQTKGQCVLCDKTSAKSAMARHLRQCVLDHKPAKSSPKAFLIIAYAGPYWLFFEVPTTTSLKKVDKFLRDVWLECCGHLSRFTINNERYDVHPDNSWGGEDKSMRYPLGKVLSVGSKFSYEYDFGSTTELELNVLAVHSLVLRKKKGDVRILARNEPPSFICQKCNNAPADQLCGECIYKDKGFFCDKCAKRHEEHEEMFLPVVNSPRMGECGYCG
jgi:hypothetical protein